MLIRMDESISARKWKNGRPNQKMIRQLKTLDGKTTRELFLVSIHF